MTSRHSSTTVTVPIGSLISVAALIVMLLSAWAAWLTFNRAAEQTASPIVARPPATQLVPPAVVTPGPSTTAPTTSGSTTPPATSGLIALDPNASGNPDAESVRALLERHFTAINNRDYRLWTSTVSNNLVTELPPETWARDYKSTVDDMISVQQIRSVGPNSAVVRLSFVSAQDPADAPPDLRVYRICWSTQWPVTSLDSGGLIGIPPKGSTNRTPC